MFDLQQNTDEWLEFRKSRIGGSDAPIISGVSPWKTPYDLWLEKLGLKKTHYNENMQRGHDLEPTARFEFEIEYGYSVSPRVIVHPEYDWMIASLDGIDSTGKKIVEIKCPGREDHSQALSGIIPEKYFPQLQHQIEVAQVDQVNYFSWSPDCFVNLVVHRDDAFIKKLIEKEKEFYECLQQLTPPALGNRDYVQRNDGLWKEVSEHWKNVRRQLNELELKEKELRETLIHLSGDKNCVGSGVKVMKTARRGSIDYREIPELQNVDLELYRKPNITCWRLTDA